MDEKRQRDRLLDHLAYYERVLPIRDAAYNQLKRTIIIPRIHIALKKIEVGSYRLCDDCAEYIPDARLELIPGALRCITCQTISEVKRR